MATWKVQSSMMVTVPPICAHRADRACARAGTQPFDSSLQLYRRPAYMILHVCTLWSRVTRRPLKPTYGDVEPQVGVDAWGSATARHEGLPRVS